LIPICSTILRSFSVGGQCWAQAIKARDRHG